MKQPFRELVIAPNGEAMSSHLPRYETLAEYAEQFPDRTKLGYFWQFIDPMIPGHLVILSLLDDGEGLSSPFEGDGLDRTDMLSAVYDATRDMLASALATTDGRLGTQRLILDAVTRGAREVVQEHG